MKIMVVDGQGGRLGAALIERLKPKLSPGDHILAIGTNALATAAMVKAGAQDGVTGENAARVNAPKVDVIAGGIGILAANSMLGELSEGMAVALSSSDAKKVVVPVSRCNILVAGQASMSFNELLDDAVRLICEGQG